MKNMGDNTQLNVGDNIEFFLWLKAGEIWNHIQTNIYVNIRPDIVFNIESDIYKKITFNIGSNIQDNICEGIRLNLKK